MKKQTKISFIGDLTVDKPLLNYSHIGNNKFDFDKVFHRVKDDFRDSDLVIGNLETTFAGSDNYLNTEFMLLNTPDEFAESIKKANINILTTANNHTLDKDIDGLKRTINLLDNLNIEHTGTYVDKKDYENILIKEVNGVKLAFISATYGINDTNIDFKFNKENSFHIDVLRSQETIFPNTFNGRVKKIITKIFSKKFIRKAKRIYSRYKIKKHGKFLNIYVDTIKSKDFSNEYLERFLGKVIKAKEDCDYVFVMPHMGGQFNKKPGPYSVKLMNLLLNLDVNVLANHPHVIQKIVTKNKNVGVYSIGSFNMSVSGDYVVRDSLPQYSLGVHFYFDKSFLVKSTYSIFIISECESGSIEVYPLQDYFERLSIDSKEKMLIEINSIHKRIGLNNTGIEKEYLIKNY